MATQKNNRRRRGGFVCAIWVLIFVLLAMDAGKNGIGPFYCHRDPATVVSHWERWLNSFELKFAVGKGLLIDGDTTGAVKQRHRALLLHHAGPDVQDILRHLVTLAMLKIIRRQWML